MSQCTLKSQIRTNILQTTLLVGSPLSSHISPSRTIWHILGCAHIWDTLRSGIPSQTRRIMPWQHCNILPTYPVLLPRHVCLACKPLSAHSFQNVDGLHHKALTSKVGDIWTPDALDKCILELHGSIHVNFMLDLINSCSCAWHSA
jgi:hypothetical protein